MSKRDEVLNALADWIIRTADPLTCAHYRDTEMLPAMARVYLETYQEPPFIPEDSVNGKYTESMLNQEKVARCISIDRDGNYQITDL